MEENKFENNETEWDKMTKYWINHDLSEMPT